MNEQQLAKKPQLSYTKDQVELVKSQIAPEATVDGTLKRKTDGLKK